MRKKNLWVIIFIIILGALVGSALGQVLALILPEGVVREFFLRSASFALGPAHLNLVILTFSFTIGMSINIIGVIGIILTAYFLKWLS